MGSSLVKRPMDSFAVLSLPFKSDSELRSQYINFAGQVRQRATHARCACLCDHDT